MSDTCFLCSTPGYACDVCRLVVACEVHHCVHRQGVYCAPFTVCYGEGVGHYMVAVRDIKQMEVVLREEPVVVGPYTQTTPQCLQCCRKVDGSYRCELCNFPVCNQACSEGSNHVVECGLFVRSGWRAEVGGWMGIHYLYVLEIVQERDLTTPDSQYAAVTVIRLLDMKRTKPEVFARLMRLEDHNEKRKVEEEDLWNYHQQHIVTFLKKVI